MDMKLIFQKVVPFLTGLLCLNANAETRYVDLNSPSPTPPYTSWVTAATNIQDAIDAAVAGDLVLVTNGVYRTGGRVVFGAMTNRVAVTKPITVQSVDGAKYTFIEGKSPMGASAVRCVYLTNQAQLIGFTLTNGATLASGDSVKERAGGGVWCEPLASPSSLVPVISNCVIIANMAEQNGGGGYNGRYERCLIKANVANSIGGGASGGYFRNCLIIENTAFSLGGGLDGSSAVNNCTIVSNYCASTGLGAGGVSSPGQVRNCIIYYNTNANPIGTSQNYSGGNLSYCNTVPRPFVGGSTIITNSPLFMNPTTGDFRLQAGSPCINAGINSAIAGEELDFQGDARIVAGTVDVGANEFQAATSVLSYAWAKQFGFPTDGSADFADADGDGMSNYGEWRSDTIPTNSISVLRIVGITNTPPGIQVTWNCVSSRIYYMERATNLGAASTFQNINNFLVGSSSPTRNYTDAAATNNGPYFYRVGVQ